MKNRWSRFALVLGMSAACADDPATDVPATPGSPANSPAMVPASQGPSSSAGTGSSAGQVSTAAAPGAPASSTPPVAPAIPMPAANPPGSAAPSTPTPAANPAPTAAPGIPANCQGFPLKDIKYSPGGSVLPNTCMPFHATSNNPYAVRCIDAWPWYKTKYPGDQFCILPPPPDKGLQYGFHPQGDGAPWSDAMAKQDLTGYDNLTGTPWELAPGDETNLNYYGKVSNPTQANYYRTYIRMRAGSHHMINSIGGNAASVGTWAMGNGGGLQAGDATLPSIQRTDENWPNSFEKPQEDAGLYRIFPANPIITYNVHHFNSHDEPMLRESWTNVWWEEDAKTKMQFMSDVPASQRTKLNVGPNTILDLHYSYRMTQPIRVLEMFGHRHSWTSNFSAWVERAGGGTPEIVYQSFDWVDIPAYRYDSQTKNPVPTPASKADAASTGILMLNTGDKLHFNCHIEFTDERATAVGNPPSTKVGELGFANEAVNAEMCILFGWSAGIRIGGPVEETGTLPDFAMVH